MDPLSHKLHPHRFPNMTPQMAAIVGYLLGEAFIDPALAELTVTDDSHVFGVPATAGGERGQTAFLGAAADLRANLARLGMAAGLDEAEWAAWEGLARERLGIDLGV